MQDDVTNTNDTPRDVPASAPHDADAPIAVQGECVDAPIETADDALRREVEEGRERLLRIAAEFDNFRKRAVRERQEAGWRAQGDLVRGLLDALDDLSRFSTIDASAMDAKAIIDGIGLVEKKLFKSLAGHGFEIVNPLDHPFDPSLHEALGTAPAASVNEDGVVATVYQVGYVINGHLLRPARVIVKQWTDGHG